MTKTDKTSLRDGLQQQLEETNMKLGELNNELAIRMVQLAAQTGDTAPLVEAVNNFRKAKTYYSLETAPQQSAEIQQAIADTLLTLGQKNEDREALEGALDAYRSAITIASLIGDEDRRNDLRIGHNLVTTLLGRQPKTQPLFKVA